MSNTEQHLPEELYQQLPELLAKPCLHFTTPREREACLLSMLTTISGMMYYCSSEYNGSNLYPNMHSFVTYNSNHTPQCLIPAEVTYKVMNAIFHYGYKKDIYRYYLGFGNDKTELYVPATIREANMMELLRKNDERILNIFDLQPQYMVQAHKDSTIIKLIRASQNNDSYKHYNSEGRSEYFNNITMSVLLAGRKEEITRLIPTVDCGIHQGFNFYHVDDSTTPSVPFDIEDYMYNIIENYSVRIAELHSRVNKARSIRYKLDDEAQELFIKHYALDKNNTQHTTAVNCYRIAVILGTMSYFADKKEEVHKPSLTMSPYFIKLAICIADHYSRYSQEVYEYIGEHAINTADKQGYTKEHLQVATLHGQGLSLRKMAKELYGDEGKFMKVKRLLSHIRNS